jgi:hypothetical protein
MSAVPVRRRVLLVSAALLAGVALFFALRQPAGTPEPTAAPAEVRKPLPSRGPAEKSPGMARPVVAAPPISLAAGAGMSTADVALRLAAWPEGLTHADLPKWAALLASRGTDAIGDISSALATAETNTGRAVLADALARIGTNDAIQELCAQAVKAPGSASSEAIASAFRALSRPSAVPMLATLFAEIDSEPLVTEASNAIRRLADHAGVEALADLSQEGGQLYSQRDTIFRILSTLENPDALPALEVIAADGTDTVRADAAREGIAYLKAAAAKRTGP